MNEWLLQHEVAVRLSCFLGALLILAGWELYQPRRQLLARKWVRWLNNLSLVGLNNLVIRLSFPFAAVAFAAVVEQQQWGILPQLGLPLWLMVLIAIIALDAIIYLQHVMFHALPSLWRLHRMHHADIDFDVTTGFRFHPLEIVLSMLLKWAAILLLGAPPVAVLLFEVLLNLTAMFNHSNIRLPTPVDAMLRWLVVTPDMHRVHHSVAPHETNSNFGFNLPWWDWWFGTYQAQPAAGHEQMSIGLDQFRDRKFLTLPWLLLLPFIGKVRRYAINARYDSPDGAG